MFVCLCLSGYYREGFLALQRATDRAIILEQLSGSLTEAEFDEVSGTSDYKEYRSFRLMTQQYRHRLSYMYMYCMSA